MEEIAALTPYRQCRADFSPFSVDFSPRAGEDQVDRDGVLRTLREFAETNHLQIDWNSINDAPNEALVNALSMMSPCSPKEKQALLEAHDLKGRADVLVAITEIELARGKRSDALALSNITLAALEITKVPSFARESTDIGNRFLETMLERARDYSFRRNFHSKYKRGRTNQWWVRIKNWAPRKLRSLLGLIRGCSKSWCVRAPRQPLKIHAQNQELISRAAKLAYPIRDGIPIMLPEEARPLDR